jgi:hypothetical protein
MAGVRSDGQKQVIVMMREVFLEKIDAAVPRMGFNDRASLIREAVFQMIKSEVDVRPEDKTAPGRSGKGGRPKIVISEDTDALEKRRGEIERQLAALKAEEVTLLERVSTPQAQDAILAIKDRDVRLKTMEGLKELKSTKPKSKTLKPVAGSGRQKPKSA